MGFSSHLPRGQLSWDPPLPLPPSPTLDCGLSLPCSSLSWAPVSSLPGPCAVSAQLTLRLWLTHADAGWLLARNKVRHELPLILHPAFHILVVFCCKNNVAELEKTWKNTEMTCSTSTDINEHFIVNPFRHFYANKN